MERLDEQLAFPLFDVNEAYGTKCDASARVKGLNQLVFALAGLQLIVQHPKHIRRDMLQFKLGVVSHPLLTIDLLDILALEIGTDETSLLRKQLF